MLLGIFCIKKYYEYQKVGGIELTQEELRALYCKRLEREKQKYIAETTGISKPVLSKFKNGKIDLYPYLSEKLEKYLLS